MTSYLFLFIMVILTSTAQFFVKKGSHELVLRQGLRSFLRSFFTKTILIGGGLTLIAPVFYILALRDLPLSTAYVFSSLSVVLISLIGYFAFQESLSRLRILGIALVVLGILCFSI